VESALFAHFWSQIEKVNSSAEVNAMYPQNILHLAVTILVVVFSLLALIFIAIGAKKISMKSLHISAILCLTMMLIGAIGTALLPNSVFGIFERFSTFSVVILNAILGLHLLCGKFEEIFS
jgi:hypothetical protein